MAIKIRRHIDSKILYVIDDLAQPTGAEHYYFWNFAERTMDSCTFGAPFLDRLELVKDLVLLIRVLNEYQEWIRFELNSFIKSEESYWSNRHSPAEKMITSRHAPYELDEDIDMDEYDHGDMPSIYDGYGDTGEGGWRYE